MGYLRIAAEFEGIDGFPAHEVGDDMKNTEDLRQITIGYLNGPTYVMESVDDYDNADYTLLVDIQHEGETALESLEDAMDGTKLDLAFDYFRGTYVVLRDET